MIVLSEKTKSIFSEIRKGGQKMADLFDEGFRSCLYDIDVDWKRRKARPAMAIFEKARRVCIAFVVPESMDRRQFNACATASEKRILFNVDRATAFGTTREVLAEAREMVEAGKCGEFGDDLDRMRAAVNAIKKRIAAAKAEVAPVLGVGSALWALPDPDEVKEGDDILLMALQTVGSYLQQKKLAEVIKGSTPAAAAARYIAYECTALFPPTNEVAPSGDSDATFASGDGATSPGTNWQDELDDVLQEPARRGHRRGGHLAVQEQRSVRTSGRPVKSAK